MAIFQMTAGPEGGLPDQPSGAQGATVMASYSMVIARTLESYGIPSAPVLASLGIPAVVSVDPMERLPSALLYRLYGACIAATGDPYFGLAVARQADFLDLHALGVSLMSSSTLWGFCNRIARNMRLISSSANVTLHESEGLAYLRFEHVVDISGASEDFFLAFLVSTMRKLSGGRFKPARVELYRSMPAQGAAPYESQFGSPVAFACEASVLVMNHDDLLVPLRTAAPELAIVHDGIVTAYLARLDKDDIVTGVRQKIIEMLPHGGCGKEQVADALCMSPATLQCKLARQGTSFQQLLDSTRKELACDYIRQAARTVTEITFLLGFTDTSNFTRAFKRWTGRSPSSFRLP